MSARASDDGHWSGRCSRVGAGRGSAGCRRFATALRKNPTEPKPCDSLRSSGRASACRKCKNRGESTERECKMGARRGLVQLLWLLRAWVSMRLPTVHGVRCEERLEPRRSAYASTHRVVEYVAFALCCSYASIAQGGDHRRIPSDEPGLVCFVEKHLGRTNLLSNA
eukprot:scaffold43550_cov31-Tisochrysis_lutea.AAC.2